MILGTTYSHKFASYLQLDSIKAFEEILDLKLDIIRLCCYWNEIERDKGKFDFSTIQKFVDLSEKHKQKVIMTVGMKAPRHPEFYIPSWTNSKTPEDACSCIYPFLEKTIETLKPYKSIQYWQVENEPLDPVWPTNLCINDTIVEDEISFIKKLDPTRKIVLNLWGNDKSISSTFIQANKLADIIGIDLYYKQHTTQAFGISYYKGPSLSDAKLRQLIHSTEKPVWITELQAEPWEKNMDEYKGESTKSLSLGIMEDNVAKAINLQPKAILLWGSEYWLWRKKMGDKSYWDKISSIIAKKGIS